MPLLIQKRTGVEVSQENGFGWVFIFFSTYWNNSSACFIGYILLGLAALPIAFLHQLNTYWRKGTKGICPRYLEVELEKVLWSMNMLLYWHLDECCLFKIFTFLSLSQTGRGKFLLGKFLCLITVSLNFDLWLPWSLKPFRYLPGR